MCVRPIWLGVLWLFLLLHRRIKYIWAQIQQKWATLHEENLIFTRFYFSRMKRIFVRLFPGIFFVGAGLPRSSQSSQHSVLLCGSVIQWIGNDFFRLSKMELKLRLKMSLHIWYSHLTHQVDPIDLFPFFRKKYILWTGMEKNSSIRSMVQYICLLSNNSVWPHRIVWELFFIMCNDTFMV